MPSPDHAAAAPSQPCVAVSEAARWFRDEVHPHDGQLKSYLRGNFPAVRDVDDVVQESYLRVWKARAGQEIACAKAFVFKVARHLALDSLRKARNAPMENVSVATVERVLDSSPNAAQSYNSREAIELVSDAIVALPDRCRQAVILHKIRGLSCPEVARQLGLSERSVENYVYRGIKRIEAHLRAKGAHEIL
jgi:RNA polymerase sigma factor (sigma-70 family)